MEIIHKDILSKKVRIISQGDVTKPLIIGLHGLGGSAYTFYELSELLENYHLVTIDLPGHGGSDDLETEFMPNHIIDWLYNVVISVTADPFYLLAHSWGGTVALHFSAKYPDKIKKLILLDGGYHDSKIGYRYFTDLYNNNALNYKPFMCFEDEVNYYMSDFDESTFDNFDSAVQAELSNHDRTNEWIKKSIEDLIVKSGDQYIWHARGKTAKKALQMQHDSQQEIQFDAIKCDTLLIYPDQPPVYLAHREAEIDIFRSKLDVNVKLYENTGHMVHYDQPLKLSKDIQTFFR